MPKSKRRYDITKPFTSMQAHIEELEIERRRLRQMLRQANLMIERLSEELKSKITEE